MIWFAWTVTVNHRKHRSCMWLDSHHIFMAYRHVVKKSCRQEKVLMVSVLALSIQAIEGWHICQSFQKLHLS